MRMKSDTFENEDEADSGFDTSPVPRKKRRLTRPFYESPNSIGALDSDNGSNGGYQGHNRLLASPRPGPRLCNRSDAPPRRNRTSTSTKRTRRTHPDDDEDEDGESVGGWTGDDGDDVSVSPEAKTTTATSKPKREREKKVKLKERVVESTHGPRFEDMYATQLPQIDSSPYRIRGAIWQKNATKPDPPIFAATTTIAGAAHPTPPNDALTAAAISPAGSPQAHTTADTDAHAKPAPPATLKPPIQQKFDHVELSELECGFSDSDLDFGQDESILPKAVTQEHIHEINGTISLEAQIDAQLEEALADFPSDAFDSPPVSPVNRSTNHGVTTITSSPSRPRPQSVALVDPHKGLRQTTLFGQQSEQQQEELAPDGALHFNWPLMNRPEAPTHHKLNLDAIKTWVYPTNLGTIRDYQYSIVARGLYHNLLVALPTGLGKTFIAATIMLNWYRWTADSQIVFVAPTKPLVAQQVEACLGIAGIPRSATSMLTGGIGPGLRAEDWASKRVFFMTPQTIINDLKTGICDPKRLVLIVVDEAHRATGAYSYVELIKFVRRFNQSFRVLALTATPGSSVEGVQEVIDGLDIARVEIRTEFSIDIRQYVHSRNTKTMLFDNSGEMDIIMDFFSKALQPVVNKLAEFNAYWSRDPMQLTPYGLTQARQRWMASPAGRNANFAVKGMLNRVFSVLASLAHSIDLLKYHGIGPFYQGMLNFRSTAESSKGGAGKYEKQILDSEHFSKMMTRLQFWTKDPAFIGHPKLQYLQEVILNHFMDAGEGGQPAPPVPGGEASHSNSSTRVMIFAHFRDSAEEIVRVLKHSEPMVRPHVFVGQAASKGSEGMNQKGQLEVIQKFKSGVFNTIVATSIGEEGLDIGEVDLIICYDSSASPIRMLQRMGRTGRKRAGNITLLLMRGKEERSFLTAKDNYQRMQEMIAAGTRFTFHEDRSARILPPDARPVVDKRVIDIPLENSEPGLPEPKKRGRQPKRPPKKFHMPDNVITGFVAAGRLNGDLSPERGPRARHSKPAPTSRKTKASITAPEMEPVPSHELVALRPLQMAQLRRQYQDVVDLDGRRQVVEEPRLDTYPALQRSPRPTRFVRHGAATRTVVKMLNTMHSCDQDYIDKLQRTASAETPVEREHFESCGRVIEEAGSKKKARAPTRFSKETATTKRARDRQDIQTTRESFRADTVDEGISSSPPCTSPRLHLPSQGISLGSETPLEGDEDGEDGYQLDSTLADFIVEDDDALDAELEPSTHDGYSSSSPVVLRSVSKPLNLFQSSQMDFLSQGSAPDSSFPDLPPPAGKERRSGSRASGKENDQIHIIDDSSSDVDVSVHRPAAVEPGGLVVKKRQARQTRRIVEDHSSSEDD